MRATDIINLAATLIDIVNGFQTVGSILQKYSSTPAKHQKPYKHIHRSAFGEVTHAGRVKPTNHIHAFDRTWRGDDGILYLGIDHPDGTTDWFRDDGSLECRTETPTKTEQDENDYLNDGYNRVCPHCRGIGYDPLDGGQCDYCDGLGWE